MTASTPGWLTDYASTAVDQVQSLPMDNFWGEFVLQQEYLMYTSRYAWTDTKRREHVADVRAGRELNCMVDGDDQMVTITGHVFPPVCQGMSSQRARENAEISLLNLCYIVGDKPLEGGFTLSKDFQTIKEFVQAFRKTRKREKTQRGKWERFLVEIERRPHLNVPVTHLVSYVQIALGLKPERIRSRVIRVLFTECPHTDSI